LTEIRYEIEERMNAETDDDAVRYCVTAITDLQGFSNHLEIGGSDLRTSIGLEAVKRLEVLDRSLELIASERATSAREYPSSFHCIRINDAIIITLDLPELLKPPVGDSVRRGFSGNDIARFFDLDQLPDEEAFMSAYKTRLAGDVRELVLFIGILARLHMLVNRLESGAFFPGARTVVATGYRRLLPTQRPEDFLSANVSFSNAYLAEQYLHGPSFYIDDHISRLLCANPFARNLLRYACYPSGLSHFDPNDDREDVLHTEPMRVRTNPVQVQLFRKSFEFRQLDPFPLAHLQLVPRLTKYLEGIGQPAPGGQAINTLARRTFTAMAEGPSISEDGSLVKAFGGMRLDLEDDVRVFCELIETGVSPALESGRQERSDAVLLGSIGPA
jgi:hypothetical protein